MTEVERTVGPDGTIHAFFQRWDGECFGYSSFGEDVCPVTAVLTAAGVLVPVVVERELVIPPFWGERRMPQARPLRLVPDTRFDLPADALERARAVARVQGAALHEDATMPQATITDTPPPINPDQAHHEMAQVVRRTTAVGEQAHRFAMLAKESIFRAQDMLHDVQDDELHRKLSKRLAKVRAELEALDRDWINRRRDDHG